MQSLMLREIIQETPCRKYNEQIRECIHCMSVKTHSFVFVCVFHSFESHETHGKCVWIIKCVFWFSSQLSVEARFWSDEYLETPSHACIHVGMSSHAVSVIVLQF
jgi:hypothetical protein